MTVSQMGLPRILSYGLTEMFVPCLHAKRAKVRRKKQDLND